MHPNNEDEDFYFDYINCEKYGTDCYIFSSEDKITIAWRGTEATTEDGYSLQDMIQDLKFQQTKCTFLDDTEPLVHSGFMQQYNAVRHQGLRFVIFSAKNNKKILGIMV